MKSIGLKNVKAFEDTGCIEITPITVFVGRNSCGKSSFIRFPVVLSQTFRSGAESPISLHGQQDDYTDYGNFEDVIHDDSEKSFSVSLEYPIDISDIEHNSPLRRYRIYSANTLLPDIVKVIITYSKISKGSKVFATRIEAYVNNSFFSCFDKIRDSKEYVFTQKKTIRDGELIDVDYKYNLRSPLIQNYMPIFDDSDVFPQLCKLILNIDDEKEAFDVYREVLSIRRRNRVNQAKKNRNENQEELLANDSISIEKQKLLDIFSAFSTSSTLYGYIYSFIRDDFTNLHYIGPFRSTPKRAYRREEIDLFDVGPKGDYTSSLLINDAQSDGQVLKRVSDWMMAALKSQIGIKELGENSGYYQLLITDKMGKPSNLMDVGFGISQVLPIVTQIAKARQTTENAEKKTNVIARPEIFVIEQPELHLHPAAQSELAPLFVSAVSGPGAKNKRILIETHSEHFIRALQVMVARQEITREMIRIYYVDKGEDGNSTIEEMSINDYGQFEEEWPSGFFDKAYDLSMELLKAGAQRRSFHREGE